MARKIVLHVDDSDSDARLVLIALKECSIDCDIVRLKDGQDLIDYLGCKHHYAHREPEDNKNIYLILLDINMPRMSGIEALQSIKVDTDYKDLPVVMLTTSNADSDLKLSYELGANSYIVKMFDFESLRSVILKIADNWLNINKRGDMPLPTIRSYTDK